MPFSPKFLITSETATALMRIEAAKEAVRHLLITPSVLASLRETARLFSTHYSTMIEGNRLTHEQVSSVIEQHEHFPGRERDEREVLGYYAALEKVEQLAAAKTSITEQHIQELHALVMAGGTTRVKPSPYRDGQNVIRDGRSRSIVYLPPEARDVPKLMEDLVKWIRSPEAQSVPCPIQAGIAHYQYATIHPYYDGNGRTARLLTTLILHLGSYDLKGLYSLEEYYARNLAAYYEALTIGPSHNYYEGRAEANITKWVEYFCEGVAESFQNVKRRAEEAASSGAEDQSQQLRKLGPRQRKVISLFNKTEAITSQDIAQTFAISQRAARNLLSGWVKDEFLTVVDPAKKSRKYALASAFGPLVSRKLRRNK
jgi:Fic family protein